MFAFFEKSVLFIGKLEKWSRTARLQLNKKDLYIKDWAILNFFLCCGTLYQYFIIRSWRRDFESCFAGAGKLSLC